jgi:hypothetical protein
LNLSFFTVLEYLTYQGILFSNDQIEKGEKRRGIITMNVDAVDKCCGVMTLLVLQEESLIELRGGNQYALACAIIAASRRHCKVSIPDVWPTELA